MKQQILNHIYYSLLNNLLMKRFFILASAAIVALASCAKTQVVYKDAPQEIAFKTVDMPMTKATYDADLGVVAFYMDGQEYFGMSEFKLQNGVWTGSKYWPLSTPLKFLAYGPYGAAGTVTNTSAELKSVAVPDNVDFVYSYVDNDGNGFTKKGAQVTGVYMPMKHTKSKVVVTVQTGTNETVTKVELLATPVKGDCTIAIPAGDISWAFTDADKADVDFTTDIRHLVIPSTPSILKITYDSKNPDQDGLTVEIDLSAVAMKDSSNNVLTGNWLPGYSYTYNITISSTEITVHGQTTDWIEVSNNA